MISKEQIVCDFGDFLEYHGGLNLKQEFFDFVSKSNKEEYQDLINNR